MKCQDWKKTIAETDSKKTVFVLNPPFPYRCNALRKHKGWSCENPQQAESLLQEVADAIPEIKGKVIVNFPRDHGEMICDKVKCRTWSTVQAQRNWRYLIGVKD